MAKKIEGYIKLQVPAGTANPADATRLARYKCPRAFFPVAELPRGANGKLNRRRLTAPGV